MTYDVMQYLVLCAFVKSFIQSKMDRTQIRYHSPLTMFQNFMVRFIIISNSQFPNLHLSYTNQYSPITFQQYKNKQVCHWPHIGDIIDKYVLLVNTILFYVRGQSLQQWLRQMTIDPKDVFDNKILQYTLTSKTETHEEVHIHTSESTRTDRQTFRFLWNRRTKYLISYINSS